MGTEAGVTALIVSSQPALIACIAQQFLAALASLIPLSLAFETRHVAWTGEFVLALPWPVVVMSRHALPFLPYLIRTGAATNVASVFFLLPATAATRAWPLSARYWEPSEWREWR